MEVQQATTQSVMMDRPYEKAMYMMNHNEFDVSLALYLHSHSKGRRHRRVEQARGGPHTTTQASKHGSWMKPHLC